MELKNTVELISNGKTYSLVKSIKVSKSLDGIAGSFEAVIANDRIDDLPIHVQDEIVIKINGEQVISGLVNKIDVDYSSDSSGNVSHNIKISGFDYTISVVQGQIFSNSQYASPISLKKLYEKVLEDNGIINIKVIDKSTRTEFTDISGIVTLLASDVDKKVVILTVPESTEISANTGDTIFSFMDKYARLLGVILGGDGNSAITIDEASSAFSKEFKGPTLVNKFGANNNVRILSGGSSRDYSNRFNKVLVFSQNDGGGQGDKGSGIMGIASDDVAKSGSKVIIADTVLDKTKADAMAKWEVRQRRANSINYHCAVQGFSADGKEIWKPGMVVDIQDDYAGVASRMKLRSVAFTLDETGTVTSLDFVPKDSYTDRDVDIAISNYDKIPEQRNRLDLITSGLDFTFSERINNLR